MLIGEPLPVDNELAATGIVIGAGWNGARAFTATSGPGVSLITEFLGLAYFIRGTYRDEYARYTEHPDAYTANMDWLLGKWETARAIVPMPEIDDRGRRAGILFYGTTALPIRKPWTACPRTAWNWTPCASAASPWRRRSATSCPATTSSSWPSRTATRR